MNSKALILLGLLLAALLIPSEGAADTAPKDERKTHPADKTEDVNEAKGAWGCRFGCCDGLDKNNKCKRCCHPDEAAETKADVAEETKQVDDAVAAIRKCDHGCCLRSRVGCLRCCQAAEAAETKEETNEEDDEKIIRRCRYGCCGMGRYGCVRCCRPKNPPQPEVEEETNQLVDDAKSGVVEIGACRHGCCGGRTKRGLCTRCCPASAGEADKTETEAKP